MRRALHPGEKERVVAAWRAYRDTVRGPGGQGYPDPSIFPLTDFLNAIDGVCTIQSCAGHVLTSAIDGAAYLQPAHLWLRLSTRMQTRVLRHAHRLVMAPQIERCAIEVMPWGDVFQLQFHGEERDALPASVEVIQSFFRWMTETAS